MLAIISVVISLIAFGFSIVVFMDNRRRNQRDLFLQIHQQLIGERLQRGRRILFQKAKDEASINALSDEEYRAINEALSFYNVLGYYVKNRYVRERDVMELFATPVARAWRAAQPFMAYRMSNEGYHVLDNFENLATRAEQELSRRGAINGAITPTLPVQAELALKQGLSLLRHRGSAHLMRGSWDETIRGADCGEYGRAAQVQCFVTHSTRASDPVKPPAAKPELKRAAPTGTGHGSLLS